MKTPPPPPTPPASADPGPGPESLIRRADAARTLGVSEKTLRRFEERGVLVRAQAGVRRALYRATDVQKLIASM